MLYWKKWINSKKKEGDKKTPKGTFKIEHLYFRKDRGLKNQNKIKMY
jgi:L,D-peptidoglycan transpeptidase YkuD (ErfK/YbiS/YcfS/YnhG family)